MFGGVGIYIDDVFCALISPDSGSLYFKVDDSNRAETLRMLGRYASNPDLSFT